MNAFKTVQDAIDGHFCCDIAAVGRQSLMDCEHCPYNDEEDKLGNCVSRLNNDIQYFLKQELKHQEAEQQKAQPLLPGIFDDPVEIIAEKLKTMAEDTESEEEKKDFHKKKWNHK